MSILRKILEKRGIKDVTELDKEEREVFNAYDKILSKPELNLKDVQTFLETQVSIIEGRWKDYNLESHKKSELLPYHTIYKTILSIIQAPQVERETLEKYLIQLHNL